MVYFQMIYKVIIVALLISASLAVELTNNASKLQNPEQSINQSISNIQQTSSQINTSSINAGNTSIQSQTQMMLPKQPQKEERTESNSTQANNQTEVVQKGKEAQTVEIKPEKISQNEQSTKKTDEIPQANFTLEILSEKADQTPTINSEIKIENKTLSESSEKALTVDNKKQLVGPNITNEVKSIDNSAVNQTLSSSNESTLPLSIQSQLGNISISESSIDKQIQSQVVTVTNNNLSISQSAAPSNDNQQPVNKVVSQSALPSANITDSSSSTESNLQNKINESQIIDPKLVSKQQLLAQSTNLTNNTQQITSNQTVVMVENVNIQSNQSSSVQNNSSIDAVAKDSNKSQIKDEKNEIISQTIKQNIIGDDYTQVNLKPIEQETSNGSVVNIQTGPKISQILNSTGSPQNKQEDNENSIKVNKTIEEQERVLNFTSTQTGNLWRTQAKSNDSSLNPAQLPNEADDNQTVGSSQQKSQKQVKIANITIQSSSNTTEIIIFQGKLPDQVKLNSSESDKIEEVGKILAQTKEEEEENNEDQIVDKFMLQTEVDDSKENNDSIIIAHQQNSETQQLISDLGTKSDKKDNGTQNENGLANITTDIKNNLTQTIQVTKGDNSSLIQNEERDNTPQIKNQSLILLKQQTPLIDQTKVLNVSSQVDSNQVSNLTSTKEDQNLSLIETKLSIQNKTEADTANSTQYTQQNKQEPQPVTSTIQDSTNKLNTSLVSSSLKDTQQNPENVPQTNKTIQEVITIETASITEKNQNSTLPQTSASNQKLENQTTKQLNNKDDTLPVVKETQTKPLKSDNISKDIEQNIIASNQTQQEQIKNAKDTKEKKFVHPILTQQQEKKEEKQELHRKQVIKQTKEANQEIISLKAFDFQQPQKSNQNVKEKQQDTKQKPKNGIINKKPFKLHAQQLSKQKVKQKDEENNKEPRKIDQFNKQSSQLIEELAKQKKSLEKKLASNKPKETTILEQNKQTFIQEQKPKSDNQTYVIAIFVLIGVLVCHFLIKAFCGSKKKQGTRAQSTQHLAEEDEDFDLSYPDIAERLEEDY